MVKKKKKKMFFLKVSKQNTNITDLILTILTDYCYSFVSIAFSSLCRRNRVIFEKITPETVYCAKEKKILVSYPSNQLRRGNDVVYSSVQVVTARTAVSNSRNHRELS